MSKSGIVITIFVGSKINAKGLSGFWIEQGPSCKNGQMGEEGETAPDFLRIFWYFINGYISYFKINYLDDKINKQKALRVPPT